MSNFKRKRPKQNRITNGIKKGCHCCTIYMNTNGWLRDYGQERAKKVAMKEEAEQFSLVDMKIDEELSYMDDDGECSCPSCAAILEEYGE
jgi:hypothetical protein